MERGYWRMCCCPLPEKVEAPAFPGFPGFSGGFPGGAGLLITRSNNKGARLSGVSGLSRGFPGGARLRITRRKKSADPVGQASRALSSKPNSNKDKHQNYPE